MIHSAGDLCAEIQQSFFCQRNTSGTIHISFVSLISISDCIRICGQLLLGCCSKLHQILLQLPTSAKFGQQIKFTLTPKFFSTYLKNSSVHTNIHKFCTYPNHLQNMGMRRNSLHYFCFTNQHHKTFASDATIFFHSS